MERRAGDHPAPYLVIARAADGQFSMVGASVPESSARALMELAGREPGPYDPSEVPKVLDHCIALLRERSGAIECRSGPSYLVRNIAEPTVPAPIRTSAMGLHGNVALPDGWSHGEWQDLIRGSLGPWAAALVDDRVISLCHSARLTERAAEAGVWTAPEFRGQGHAAAVTAAWASLFTGDSRVLFYSTADDNLSSQRVAERLKLRQIGRMWQLSRTGPG